VLKPEEFERLARALTELYREAELRVIADVARQLRRGLRDADWAEQRLRELAKLRQRVQLQLRVLAKRTSDGSKLTLADAWKKGVAEASKELPFEVAPSTAALELLTAELELKLLASHQRILREAEDVYRSVIAEVVRQGLAGEQTRRTAAQAALDRFALRGVTGFVDRAGRSWSLASYTEMAVRTATHHATIEAKRARYLAAGEDLVIVSDAPQECSLCRPWEGKVLSLTGRTPRYATLDQAISAGLFHPNCRHTYSLYIPGVTRPRGVTEDPEGDRARQQQRYLERGIRSWKRREAAALDDQATAYARRKQREWQARLREHVEKTGGKRLRYREQITKAI
jgi:hypothetical protein